MIYDKIDNWEQYAGISEDIRLGLSFLKQLSPDVEVGVHEITPRVRAIVSEYQPQPVNPHGYEAHHEWIDIQYLLVGTEIVRCLPLEYLEETQAYDARQDAAFYADGSVRGQELMLGNGYFAILFPQDGHMPCLSAGVPGAVKKVVVKVKVHP